MDISGFLEDSMRETPKPTRIPHPRGQRLRVMVDGEPVEAYAGESVAAVLMAAGHIMYQQAAPEHPPKCLFCGMGVCFNCLVTINGVPNTRACITTITEGMVIETNGSGDE
jgi:predicted molibdopterin-dependent oxidoreductase YjgC